MKKSKVVSATGASSSSLNPARAPLAIKVREAMEQAIRECNASGVTDPVVIRERMMAARDDIVLKQ